jgi:hypothetical protein
VLTGAERRTLMTAWLLLPGIGAALRLAGTRRTLAALGRLAPATHPPEGPGPEPAELERQALLVGSAARWTPVRTTCLTRSLALRWLLRRRGIPAELRIGVRLADDRPWTVDDRESSMVHRPSSPLHAHAWVECGDVNLTDTAQVAGRYAAFERVA